MGSTFSEGQTGFGLQSLQLTTSSRRCPPVTSHTELSLPKLFSHLPCYLDSLLFRCLGPKEIKPPQICPHSPLYVSPLYKSEFSRGTEIGCVCGTQKERFILRNWLKKLWRRLTSMKSIGQTSRLEAREELMWQLEYEGRREADSFFPGDLN